MKRIFESFHPFERMLRRRNRYVDKTLLPLELKNLLVSPKCGIQQRVSELEFIVLDIETTGFDSEEETILSIGWVEITNNKIDLTSAQHLYINSDSKIKPETAIVNHITQQMLINGVSIHQAIKSFLQQAMGKILVAHGCVVEANFINCYLSRTFKISPPPLLWIDTLCLEKRLQHTINPTDTSDVTLSATRERYQLPRYNAHNALADAVATAELLLAQQARIAPQAEITIGTLYRLSQYKG